MGTVSVPRKKGLSSSCCLEKGPGAVHVAQGTSGRTRMSLAPEQRGLSSRAEWLVLNACEGRPLELQQRRRRPPPRGQSTPGHCCPLRSGSQDAFTWTELWRMSSSCLATWTPPRFPRSVPSVAWSAPQSSFWRRDVPSCACDASPVCVRTWVWFFWADT